MSGAGVLFVTRLLALVLVLRGALLAQTPKSEVLDSAKLAADAFGGDAPWYLANIPFLAIDDPEIQRLYYYRWKVYRSHLRDLGTQGSQETEFLNDISFARHPSTDLNDSSSFHIMEGRWLRDPKVIASLVDHLYSDGGNDRHFSESIAAATLAWTQVTGDVTPALQHLDSMRYVYSAWDDHFDAARGLYWIEPLLDATEYTISSIDASGAGFTENASTNQNENGFTKGYAFRPSINSFQYANAKAIASFAAAAGKPAVAAEYQRRAERLRSATLSQLWNPSLLHFTDIYQRSTPYVAAGSFIRGRELVGFVPWMYELPPVQRTAGKPDYAAAWSHALDPKQLAGPYGLRTVEPSYPRYLWQYRYDPASGRPACQWNGPAWPFQISQTLTGVANLLQQPEQHAVTAGDYLHLLRQYARLQLNAAGEPDVQEDYNPDTGRPIVGLSRSHHYNHSTFNDLVLSGLLGVRPRSDDVLEVHPLLAAPANGERPIRFFALQGLRYHDRELTLVYDEDGKHYAKGAGLSVFAAGKRVYGPVPLQGAKSALIPLGSLPRAKWPRTPELVNYAVNVWERIPSAVEEDLPMALASSTAAGTSPYQAIDGRTWFFPEIVNGWSPAPQQEATDAPWFEVDLRQSRTLDRVELAFFADGTTVKAPTAVELQTYAASKWQRLPEQHLDEPMPVANGITHLRFPAGAHQRLRLMVHAEKGAPFRLVELKALGPIASSANSDLALSAAAK